MQIIPTILEKNFEEAERKMALVKNLVSWIQIDVIDGVFSNGKTFELELLKRLDFEIEDNLLDIHLMVNEPIKWINKADFAGGARVIGQVEMMTDREMFVSTVKDKNMEAGLAFDVETEIKDIPEETDVVVLMGRKAGFEGKDEHDSLMTRIETLKKIREKSGDLFVIGVDGGVKKGDLKKLAKAGVGIVYCGRAVFEGEAGKNLEELKKI